MSEVLTQEEKEAIFTISSLVNKKLQESIFKTKEQIEDWIRAHGREDIDCLNDAVFDVIHSSVDDVLFHMDLDETEREILLNAQSALEYPEAKEEWEKKNGTIIEVNG